MHNDRYVKAYKVCFIVYASFFFAGLMPYIFICIEEKSFIFIKKEFNDHKKQKIFAFFQLVISIPLFFTRGIKLVNLIGGQIGYHKVTEFHTIPLITQAFIMIPLIIIESIFWGRSCDKLTNSDSQCIQDPYLLMADKAFAITVPLSLVWYFIVFLIEDHVGRLHYNNWW